MEEHISYKRYIDILMLGNRQEAIDYVNKFIPENVCSYFKKPMRIKKRVEQLLNGDIWFSKKVILNDPFEFTKVILKDLKKEDLDYYAEVNNCIEIFCLTVETKNKLMWSHYASGYTGFCVEFRRTCKGYNQTYPIEYMKSRPDYSKVYDDFGKIVRKIQNDKNYSLNEEELNLSAMLSSIYCYKDIEWDYEKEFRLISRSEEKIGSLHKYSDFGLDISSIILGSKASVGLKRELRNAVKVLNKRTFDEIKGKMNENTDENIIGLMCLEKKLVLMKQLYIDDDLNLQMNTLTNDLFEDIILTKYTKKFLGNLL